MSGDERPGVIAADIVFVVDEKNHVSFRRDGNDLIYSARLSLTEALCGTTLNIPHLDGTTIPLPVQDIISPNAMKVVRYVRLLLS
jgi:DnaJ-class molecular chaperone